MPLTQILDQGERVLWQGRPNARIFITPQQIARVVRVVIALMLLVYILARLGYGVPPLTDIRVIVILIIFQAVPLEIIKSAFLRKRSTYVLTNRRAIIAVQLPYFGQVIRSLPINAATSLVYRLGKRYSAVYFGAMPRKFWDLRGYAAADGFERIAEGAAVFALIGQVQQGTA
jgi:hypothetical protein